MFNPIGTFSNSCERQIGYFDASKRSLKSFGSASHRYEEDVFANSI